MKALNTIDNASTAKTVLKQCCKDDKFVDALHEGCQNVCTGAVRLHPDEHNYVRRYHTKLIEGLATPKLRVARSERWLSKVAWSRCCLPYSPLS